MHACVAVLLNYMAGFGLNLKLLQYFVCASIEALVRLLIFVCWSHARIQRGGGTGGPDPPPLKYHKNIGFLSNTGPDPLTNPKATKPANIQCWAIIGGMPF